MFKVIETKIPDVKIVEPTIYKDKRGFFLESFNLAEFQRLISPTVNFVQDNHSHSEKNVLRGLHYQTQKVQGKLVRVVSGEVFDVAVDLREKSPTFKQWVGIHLNAEKLQMVWIPPGFAHGFLTLSPYADFLYKTTDYYDSASEHCLRWDDPELAIEWPIQNSPILSEKDGLGKSLKEAVLYP
jgi:dTDP-4-dehydrorhamnose 3,5-epimerase